MSNIFIISVFKMKFDIKQYCLIPPPYGGITVYVSRLINRLNIDGISTGGFFSSDNKDSVLRESPLFDEINYSLKASIIKRLFGHIQRVISVLPYRLIHFHGLEMMVIPWILKKVFKKIIIVTVHSAMIVDFYKSTSRQNRFFFKKLATSNTYWIAVSEQAKEEMYKLPFHFKHEIPVIPAYIPAILAEKDNLPETMTDYIKSHKKNISFYGRSFMVYKGQDVYGFKTIIDLYSRIIKTLGAEVGLVFCLSENRDCNQIGELHQIAKEKNVDDLIYWQIGPLSSLQPLWSCTDIYVRPTFTDGDSVAVREAIDAGMMVIASDVCQRPEGVITYCYDSLDQLEEKCVSALKENHRSVSVNDRYYEEMKKIYISLLSNTTSN